MRAEVKVGLIVGLVAVAGGGIWWFSRPTNELEELPFDRPAMEAASAKDTVLAGDNVPAPAETRSPDRPAPGPTPEKPAATKSPVERPGERALGEIKVEPSVSPPKDSAPAEKPDAVKPADTSKPETVKRAVPAESAPPALAAPSRRPVPSGPKPPGRKTYVIQPGDRLIDIAREEYADGELWKAIKAANPDLDEYRLQIGAEIEIPSPAEALRLAGTTPQRVAEKPPLRPALRPDPDQATPGRATYVVGPGDSLIRIAREVLEDETRWEEIFELNGDQLESPHLLRIGMELRLPALEKNAPGNEADRD